MLVYLESAFYFDSALYMQVFLYIRNLKRGERQAQV